VDLSAGTQYWLVLTPADSGSLLGWADGGTSSDVPEAYSLNGSSYTAFTGSLQFEIDGTPLTSTPEPRAAWLLTAGICAGALMFRRKSKAGRSA
jgi:hypothetical protein